MRVRRFSRNDARSICHRVLTKYSREKNATSVKFHQFMKTKQINPPLFYVILNLVAHLKAQQTKMMKRAFLKKKFPYARSFQRKIKFVPKNKPRRGWIKDSISIDKREFELASSRQQHRHTQFCYRIQGKDWVERGTARTWLWCLQ